MATASQFYGLDLVWLKRHKENLLRALDAISLGQSYSIGDKTLTRADYDQILSAAGAVQAEISRQESETAEGQQPSGMVVYADFRNLTQ